MSVAASAPAAALTMLRLAVAAAALKFVTLPRIHMDHDGCHSMIRAVAAVANRCTASTVGAVATAASCSTIIVLRLVFTAEALTVTGIIAA